MRLPPCAPAAILGAAGLSILILSAAAALAAGQDACAAPPSSGDEASGPAVVACPELPGLPAAPAGDLAGTPPLLQLADPDLTLRRARGRVDHVLVGTLTRPAQARGPVPAVVLISGSGPHERDMGSSQMPGYRPFLQIAETLTRRGIAVLRVDDRGVGASTGNFDRATPRDFARDVEAALDYLRARKDIDGKRLGVVGHSEGGLVALMVAAGDRTLRGVVLLASPGRDLRSIVAYQTRYRIDRNLSIPLPQRDQAVERVMREWDLYASDHPRLRFSRSYDPIPTARKVRSPVLILHGETDRQVPPEDADQLARALRASGNGDVTVRMFPGVNHAFLADPVGSPRGYARLPSKTIPEDVLGALADWSVERLGTDGGPAPLGTQVERSVPPGDVRVVRGR